MLVESGKPEIERALSNTASLIQSTGGLISDRLIVREQDGHFSCATTTGTPAGEILVQYDPQLTVPMHRVEWLEDPESFIVARAPDDIGEVQRQLLDEWVLMVNSADKLRRVRQSLPRFVINSWPLRHHLAAAGYPYMRERSDLAKLRKIAMNWHCRSMETNEPDPLTGEQIPGMGLIPLKHLVNHHPLGSRQMAVKNKVSVAASVIPGTDETFENYGNLDAFKLIMGFGFRSEVEPLVHSVPTSFEHDSGSIHVEWTAPRAIRGARRQDVPQLRADEGVLRIHDLTFRPHNRERTTAFLQMALIAHVGNDMPSAMRLAQETLDAIVAANLKYYRTLDDLVVDRLRQLSLTSAESASAADPAVGSGIAVGDDVPAADVTTERALLNELALVSVTQQDKIKSWWS
jgi:hypothetical protein